MKILCVGQNYAKHTAELGSATPTEPIWFLKPDTAITRDAVRVPRNIGAVHHEVELALRIGADGRPDAMTVAVDVTARDLQNIAKKAGRPWAMAKGFDTFLPLGEWVPLAEDLQDLRLRLAVGGEVRQDATTADMTWPVSVLLRYAATWTTLREGDILLTGTPDGVGPLAPGETIVAEIVDHVLVRIPVVEA